IERARPRRPDSLALSTSERRNLGAVAAARGTAEHAPMRLGLIEEPQRAIRAGAGLQQCRILLRDQPRDLHRDRCKQRVRLREARTIEQLQLTLGCDQLSSARLASKQLVERRNLIAVVARGVRAPGSEPRSGPFAYGSRLGCCGIERLAPEA